MNNLLIFIILIIFIIYKYIYKYIEKYQCAIQVELKKIEYTLDDLKISPSPQRIM